MRCPSPADLTAYAAGQLDPADRAAVAEHLAGCDGCRATVAAPPNAAADTARLWRHELNVASGRKPVTAPSSLDWSIPAPDPGRVPSLPGFELLGEIGRGGMGVVYKARQVALDRTVAIKMILASELADPANLLRFRDEAAAVGRLQHPNIVQVYEVGEADGRPFIVLEYVGGGTLAQAIGGVARPPAEAAAVTETLARAVHFAHERGVVHRDLKPGNVLLGGEVVGWLGGKVVEDREPTNHPTTQLPNHPTTPKITDFGLARAPSGPGDADRPTRPGLIVGTPQYMAPEQADGGDIGPAADVYALGAILYEQLTGQPPFQGGSAMDTLLQVRLLDPIPPRFWQPKVPRDLETVALKCLAKEPERRYATAAELAGDLERWRTGRPIHARRASTPEKVAKWARRYPAVAALSVAVVLAAALGVAGVVWQWNRAEARSVQAEAARDDAERARLQAETHRESAEARLYFNRIAQAQLHRDAGAADRAADLLRLCRPAAGRPDRRGWEWHYLDRLCRSELRVVEAHDQWAYAVAVSPDGTTLATVGGGNPFYDFGKAQPEPGELRLWDAATGRAGATVRAPKHLVTTVAFHPDGHSLVTGSHDGAVTVCRFANAATPQASILGTYAKPIEAVAYRPGGRELTAAGNGGAHVFDATTGAERLHFAANVGDIHGAAYRPDGKLVALCWDNFVELFDADTGTTVRTLNGPTRAVRSAAFRGDGQRVAAASDDGTVWVWDAATGRAERTLKGFDGGVWSVAYAPAGDVLAAASADGTVRLWDFDGDAVPVIYRGHREAPRGVAFAPDGRTLYSVGQDGTLRSWDTHRDPRARVLPSTGERLTLGLAFRPDGRVVAVRTGAAAVERWDADTGLLDERFALPGWLTSPRIRLDTTVSPDGMFVAGVSATTRGVVRVWAADSGKELASFKVPLFASAMAFSPDSRRLAVFGADIPNFLQHRRPTANRVTVWDWREKSCAASFEIASWPIQALAYSPDGQRLALGGGHTEGTPTRNHHELHVHDAATGERICSMSRPASTTVLAVAFSPNGRFLASAMEQTFAVDVSDAATGAAVERLTTGSRMTAVAFSPDGTRLAAAGLDPVVQLWDVATWQEALTLRAPLPRRPEDRVFLGRLAFGPGGTRLASTTWNGAVTIWDARPTEPR